MAVDETKIEAIGPAANVPEGVFYMGRLNLQKLGLRDRILRRKGKLNRVYIAKPRSLPSQKGNLS